MLIKIFVIVLLIIIVYCLASAVFFMLRDKGGSRSMVKALTWRISLSLGLFILLLIAFFLGWITPHGIYSV